MLCEKFKALTVTEKIQLIGRLIHCVQSDNLYFNAAEQIISKAEIAGLFNGVIINPQTTTDV